MGRPRKYQTEEERKAAKREVNRKYYQTNKEKIAEQKAEYRQNNKEKIAEHNAEYKSTPKGRAANLLSKYRYNDEKYNRGECTLTADWIIEHIFSQPCAYCGKTDWTKMGCDRIDNSLPHTPDNVVPCCLKCNIKKQKIPYDEYMRLIGKIA